MVYKQRIDPYTKKPFIPERANQIFSTRINQIRYNNLKALRKRRAKSKYDRALDRNRTIMEKLLNGKETVIKSRDWLEALDFSFDTYTHVGNYKEQTIAYCYEFGIRKLDKNSYEIIRHDG
jgi:hypothetical protein